MHSIKMKKIFLFSILSFLSTYTVFAGIIVLEGKYQDKNLYIKNSFAGNGVGFCTYEVSINGKVSTDEVNSSAFEIDFSALNILPGTSVIVEIKHKDDCSPRVINPEALKPKATFEVVNINIDKNGLLIWSTKNETGSLPFIVEQFRWNRWVQVGEVQGSGKKDANNYMFQTNDHSGENMFRIKQIGFNGIKESNTVKFIALSAKPSMNIKASSNIEFSIETMFEVYDVYGKILKRGFGRDLSINDLTMGQYYLCYDNTIVDFLKK
jgi:hypothetical protein